MLFRSLGIRRRCRLYPIGGSIGGFPSLVDKPAWWGWFGLAAAVFRSNRHIAYMQSFCSMRSVSCISSGVSHTPIVHRPRIHPRPHPCIEAISPSPDGESGQREEHQAPSTGPHPLSQTLSRLNPSRSIRPSPSKKASVFPVFQRKRNSMIFLSNQCETRRARCGN